MDVTPDQPAPKSTISRPRFVTWYVCLSLLAGGTLCYESGRRLSLYMDSGSLSGPFEKVLNINPTVWGLGCVPIAVGLVALIGVWLMRWWGWIAALLVHTTGTGILLVDTLLELTGIGQEPGEKANIGVVAFFLLLTVWQIIPAYWLVRHYRLFWRRRRSDPDVTSEAAA